MTTTTVVDFRLLRPVYVVLRVLKCGTRVKYRIRLTIVVTAVAARGSSSDVALH